MRGYVQCSLLLCYNALLCEVWPVRATIKHNAILTHSVLYSCMQIGWLLSRADVFRAVLERSARARSKMIDFLPACSITTGLGQELGNYVRTKARLVSLFTVF